ncbi:SAM-dependent methyltransferase [Streptomyces narbonensis]
MNQEYEQHEDQDAAEDDAEATRRDAGDAESSRASRGWWDRNADEYQSEHGAFLGDDRFVWGPEGLDEAEAELLGPAAALKGRDVLEIGAGAAQCSRWLAAHGARPVALDLSHRQLQHALRIGGGVPLVEADAGALPFRDGSFDLVCSAYGAVPFVADPVRVFREVRRVLRPGGRWGLLGDCTRSAGRSRTSRGRRGCRWRPRTSTARPMSSRTSRAGPCTWSTTGRSGTGCGTWWPAASGFVDLVEPEWPAWNSQEWGGVVPAPGEPDPGHGRSSSANARISSY